MIDLLSNFDCVNGSKIKNFHSILEVIGNEMKIINLFKARWEWQTHEVLCTLKIKCTILMQL